MLNEFCPNQTLAVRPVETRGARFALPERDVIGVLPLDAATRLEAIGGVLTLMMDERARPVISLGDQLCLKHPGADETEVVIVRVGPQLFGVLVAQVGEPCRATVHPTRERAPVFAVFSDVVRLSDGDDVPVLNPNRLAFSVPTGAPSDNLALAA
jgi:chemotaxis protein histidine kinase CheA